MRKRVKKTLSSLNGLLTREQTEILRTASLLILPTILTKIAGQVFNLIVAAMYGTSEEAFSLFIVADALPQMVANVLLFGVVGAIVIPIFVEVKEKENKEAFINFYSTVFNLAIILFSVVAIFIVIFADKLMPFVLGYLIDPNEVPSPDQINLVIDMMRVLFIPQIILGASVFVASGLNVYNRFLLPQLSPLFYNVGMLFGAIVMVPVLDKSPWALVWGVIIGSILHLLVPIPLARTLGLRIRPQLDLRSKYLRKLTWVAIPRLLAFSAEQVGSTVSKFVTFGFSYAFTSAQFFANSLIYAIPSLFGLSFATASYPTLASLYSRREHREFTDTMIKTINQIVFLALPVIVTVLILRLPVVRLVYGLLKGAFDRESTYMTSWLLLFLGIGVIFTTLRGFTYRVFYAAQNTIYPLVVSLISMMVTIVGSVLFSNYLSHFDSYSLGALTWVPEYFLSKSNGRAAVGGVGLAISIATALEVILLLYIFHKLIIRYDAKKLLSSLSRKAIPATAMAVVMYVMYKMWSGLDALPVDAEPGFSGSTTMNLLILTGITVFTSFMVYYLLCMLLQVEELKIMRRILNPILKLGGLEIK